SGIDDLDLDHVAAGRRPDRERAAAVLHDVDRVVDEIQEDLLDARHVDLDRRQPRGVLLAKGYRLERALPLHHGESLLEDRIEIGDLWNELALTAEMQEIADDVPSSSGFLLDEVELLSPGLPGRDLLGEIGGESEHTRQRVVDLVGDIGRQLADRGELG